MPAIFAFLGEELVFSLLEENVAPYPMLDRSIYERRSVDKS
jgi:hypothetical protein